MQFEWVKFYNDFATKLLNYKDDRKSLIDKIKAVYEAINIKLPTLERENKIEDIDPFTIFGLFNKQITKTNRVAIISEVAKEFDIVTSIPNSFDGVPVLNNLKATFYYFKGDRAENDIDNLWKLFIAAITLSEHDNEINRTTFIEAYDKVRNQLGIRWNITMGLYWIRPYFYVNCSGQAFL